MLKLQKSTYRIIYNFCSCLLTKFIYYWFIASEETTSNGSLARKLQTNFGRYEKMIVNAFKIFNIFSIFFNKFQGNCSTLVLKTLIFGNKMAIFEVHNTLEAACILTKKQTCWKCCCESFIYLLSQITRKYSTFFFTFPIVENQFHVIHTKRTFMVRN